MSVLVVYATVEGQSAKIADFTAGIIRDTGLDVTLLDTSRTAAKTNFDGIDKVVLVASVHERRHPKAFEDFLVAHGQDLQGRKTLMLSVSLSAAFPEGQEDATDYLDEMKMRTGLDPDMSMLVPGAVRHLSYDYYAREVLRHIVLRDRDYDPDQGDREFTDWDALRASIESFLAD